MKKKIVAVLLASVMALSLSACGGSKTDSSSSKSDTKKEKTVKPDKKSDEATTEDSSDKANSSESESSDQGNSSTSESSDQGNDSASSASDTQTVSSLDMDKCISDLKANLPLDPDYTYVHDYYIGVKDDTITITAVVDDSTDPSLALDFADTLVRQLNLYAQMQDSSIESSSQNFYGGLYTRYNALVGVAPASKTNSQKDWFVYDGISGGKVMLKLNKQNR